MTGLSLDVMLDILPKMLHAAWVTIEICALTIVFSVAMGFVLATVRLLGGRVSSTAVLCFTSICRSRFVSHGTHRGKI